MAPISCYFSFNWQSKLDQTEIVPITDTVEVTSSEDCQRTCPKLLTLRRKSRQQRDQRHRQRERSVSTSSSSSDDSDHQRSRSIARLKRQEKHLMSQIRVREPLAARPNKQPATGRSISLAAQQKSPPPLPPRPPPPYRD